VLFRSLGAPRPDPRPARRASAEASRSGPDALVVDRLRPPEKTPLIASGVTLIVAAGGLYALAAQRRQRFDDPDGAGSLEELGALRNQVNGLVLASAATLVVGVSGATWGAFVDARGRARLRIRL